MLAKLFKEKLAGATRFYGRKDFLKAVCAASALIAIADGEIEEKEEAAAIKAIRSNEGLAAGFSPRDIEACAERMFERAKGGRMGRAGLYREIEDIAKDRDAAEMVLYAALDVSDSDGEVEPAEKIVIAKIAETLGLDPKNFDV